MGDLHEATLVCPQNEKLLLDRFLSNVKDMKIPEDPAKAFVAAAGIVPEEAMKLLQVEARKALEGVVKQLEEISKRMVPPSPIEVEVQENLQVQEHLLEGQEQTEELLQKLIQECKESLEECQKNGVQLAADMQQVLRLVKLPESIRENINATVAKFITEQGSFQEHFEAESQLTEQELKNIQEKTNEGVTEAATKGITSIKEENETWKKTFSFLAGTQYGIPFLLTNLETLDDAEIMLISLNAKRVGNAKFLEKIGPIQLQLVANARSRHKFLESNNTVFVDKEPRAITVAEASAIFSGNYKKMVDQAIVIGKKEDNIFSDQVTGQTKKTMNYWRAIHWLDMVLQKFLTKPEYKKIPQGTAALASTILAWMQETSFE